MAIITKRNKQIASFVAFMVALFVICVSVVFVKTIVVKFTTEMAADSSIPSVVNTANNEMVTKIGYMDYGIFFVFIGLTIGLIISAFLVQTHPLFLVINIIGIIFLVLIGAVLSNTYESIVTASPINDTMVYGSNSLSNVSYFMSNLPFICAIIVALITIIMYGKGRSTP